jgi:hypothetical protein
MLSLWQTQLTGKEKRPMTNFPAVITPINHVEPVPRRIRAFVGATAIIDTLAAR